MTPQQRADIWLKVWRELRDLGYSPEQRDHIIEREYKIDGLSRLILELNTVLRELDVGYPTFETT